MQQNRNYIVLENIIDLETAMADAMDRGDQREVSELYELFGSSASCGRRAVPCSA